MLRLGTECCYNRFYFEEELVCIDEWGVEHIFKLLCAMAINKSSWYDLGL